MIASWASGEVERGRGNQKWCRTRAAWLAQESAEEVDGVLASLPARSPKRHQDRLGMGTDPGAVAAPGFAQDDAEANRQFGTPVSGVEAGVLEEGQQVVAVIPQVLGQRLVGGVRFGRVDGIEQLRIESAAADVEAVTAELAVEVAVAEVESVV